MASNPTLQDLRIGHLEYNGFTFPALTDIKAVTKPIYDDSNNVVKYYAVELSVSFIYYPTAEDLPSNIDLSNNKTYSDTSYLPTYMSSIATDLRNRLLQPSQPFSMTGMGFGDISWTTASGNNQFGNGVIPIDCTWAPIAGNIIAQFTWKASFNLSPGCLGSLNSSRIVSLNYSVNWESSEETSFQFIRSISGTIEFRNSRNEGNTSLSRPRASSNLGSLNQRITESIYPVLRNLFPKPAGYKRSRRMSLAEDNRTLSFDFTDVEIMKDVAPPRPILDLRMRNPIQSDLSQAFKIWKVGFSGDVTVAKARDRATNSFSSQKKLAWVAIGRMIAQRLQKAKGYRADEEFGYTGVVGGTPSTRNPSSSIMLDSIMIEDHVNENGFSFSLQYRILYVSEKDIVQASGVFDTLGLPGETWERREQYLASIGAGEDAIMPWPQDRPPIFDACNNPEIASAYESNDNKTETASQRSETLRTQDNYLKYENSYQIEELNQSSIHVPLSNSQEARREVSRGEDPQGLIPNTESTYGGSLPVVTNPTAKTYIITMFGYAIRAGVPMTPPNLISYLQKPCIKVGVDKTVTRQTVVGVVLNPAQTSTSIYKTSWVKKYLVYGNLPAGQIASLNSDLV
jgi:hypothetical protein